MKKFFKPILFTLLCVNALILNAQVPRLNSYPTSSAVLFLDFDGHLVDNTSWNIAGPISCAASGLTNDQITEVFNRVSEDYRPFALNITTDSTKFWAAPVDKRIRVIITTTYSWYGSGAGGVSFVNTFGDPSNTPCFIFSSLLGYNIKQISEAASHEAGHTLGLFHQAKYDNNCVKISDYNTGTGSGEIGWAPIMGVGYYQNLTLWNIGPNPYGCSNVQNDMDVITTNNGISLRPDDYADNYAGATSLPFLNNAFTAQGIITSNTDVDMLKVVIPFNGRFRLDAIPYNVGTGNSGSNLDMQVSLYNSSQTLLNTYNPSTLLSSVIDSVLNPGTYFLKVEGKGNIYAPNYASLGSYSLQGSFSGGTLPLRRLELRGAINNNQHQLAWTIDADEQITDLKLEKSTDGRNFTTLTDAPIALRNFNYDPITTGTIQYRLNVTFDNGRQYYSNIVTLKNNGTKNRPQLITNLIYDNSVEVQSPGSFNYSIYDFSGKTLAAGKLVNGSNHINARALSTSGMYFIRFNDGASGIWTDKFVKQ